MKIGICDDDLRTCSELESYIINYFVNIGIYVDTYIWNSGETLMNDIPDKINVDILFLDIELPDYNGLKIGNYIREQLMDNMMQIVFISYYTNYALDLFKIHPYDFLVKTISEDKVKKTLDGLMKIYELDERFFLYLSHKNIYKVFSRDIIYFQSEKRHIKIITNDECIEYVGRLKTEAAKLPMNFVAIGQSYIINLRHMKKCDYNSVIMDNSDEINISRSYRKHFKQKMIEFKESWNIWI